MKPIVLLENFMLPTKSMKARVEEVKEASQKLKRSDTEKVCRKSRTC